jgi:Delta3,5-Delta2,4-dienoyl-CoA isomerase
LAFTARFFGSDEALARGFVSQVTDSPESCLESAVALAKLIASKSPVAVTTTKLSLNYSRDHSVQEGLDHILLLNSAMLQTDDLPKAAMANMQKTKAVYPKL